MVGKSPAPLQKIGVELSRKSANMVIRKSAKTGLAAQLNLRPLRDKSLFILFTSSSKIFSATMEFPPTGWEIFGAEDFETAAPRVAGDAVMELMAQIRPNGRVMDHWRVAIGGAKILEVTFGSPPSASPLWCRLTS